MKVLWRSSLFRLLCSLPKYDDGTYDQQFYSTVSGFAEPALFVTVAFLAEHKLGQHNLPCPQNNHFGFVVT